MDIFFCDACAVPRAQPGLCSERCASALSAARTLHTTRSRSKVIVPVGSAIGQIFSRVCASAKNEPANWRNSDGAFVLPASLVDGISAHLLLRHIGANGGRSGAAELSEAEKRLIFRIQVEALYGASGLSPSTRVELSAITPEMIVHIVPHLAWETLNEMSTMKILPQSAHSELEKYFYAHIKTEMEQRKKAIAATRAKEAPLRKEKRAQRLAALEKSAAEAGSIILKAIDPELYASRFAEFDKAIEELRTGEDPPYSTALSPREKDVAEFMSRLMAHGNNDTDIHYLMLAIQRLTQSERIATQDSLLALPYIDQMRRRAFRSAYIILREAKMSAQEKTAAANAVLANTPLLGARRAPVFKRAQHTMPAIDINIEGPNITYIFYSPLHDKTIALVGEVHMQEIEEGRAMHGYKRLPADRVCPTTETHQTASIANYVRAVLAQTERRVDFFLEYHPRLVVVERSDRLLSYWLELRQKLPVWAKNEPEKLRLHWTDVRSTEELYEKFSSFEKIHYGVEKGSPPPQHYDLPQSLSHPLFRAIEKQVKKTSPYVAWFIERKFKEAREALMHVSDATRNQAYFNFFSSLVDFYTLGRMFKPHYFRSDVICYHGAQHTWNLTRYLQELGCELLAQSKGSVWHCLPLRPQRDPCFFLRPLQEFQAEEGLARIVALLMRPTRYINTNNVAPRYSLIGLLGADYVRYQDEDLALLASYAASSFDVSFSLAYYGKTSFAIVIRSDKFQSHATTADKTLIAVYRYDDIMLRLSDYERKALPDFFRHFKMESEFAAPQ